MSGKYPVGTKLEEQLENGFTYHAPTEDQVVRITAIRDLMKSVAFFMCKQCPQSRELSLALTNLEQANFWANAAIVRNE